MSDAAIAPALTPEQWDEIRERGGTVAQGRQAGAFTEGHTDAVAVSLHTGFRVGYFEGTARHALAALALHGQPFGFTHEMVKALEERLAMADIGDGDRISSRAEWAEAERETALAREAIAHIAALLQPKDRS